MPIQPPSLSELLQAYHNNGAADAINAGTQGVMNGMQLAGQRQKAQLDQQNALTQQAIAKQQADAATRDANSHFVSGDAVNAAMAGQPVTGEQPVSLIDALTKQKENEAISSRHSQDLKYQADEAAKTRAAAAAEATAARAATAASTLQGARERNVDVATNNAVKAHSWLPWTTAAERMANASLDQANQAAFGRTPSIPSFASEQEAAAANPPVGSTVLINGVKHVVGSK